MAITNSNIKKIMIFEIRFQDAIDILSCNGHYFCKFVCFKSVKILK